MQLSKQILMPVTLIGLLFPSGSFSKEVTQTHAASRLVDTSFVYEDPHVSQPDFANYLVGVVATGLRDNNVAAKSFDLALQKDPLDKALQQKTFFYSVLASKPRAIALAKNQPDEMLTNLVLGNDAVRQKDWDKANYFFKKLAGNPLSKVISPLLHAWVLQGKGQTKEALSFLDPYTDSNVFAAIYAMHAGFIAEANNKKQAGQYYYRAQSAFTSPVLLLTEAYSQWLYQNNRIAEANQLITDLVTAIPALSLATLALKAAMKQHVIITPQQGIARAYLMVASLVEEQMALEKSTQKANERGLSTKEIDAEQTEEFMLRFALDMDPNLEPARLMMSGLYYGREQPQQALDVLSKSNIHGVLDSVIKLRQARLYAILGDKKKAQIILETLLHSFPNDAEIWRLLGDIYLDEKNYGQAIKAYDTSFENTNKMRKDNWSLLMARAVAYDRAGKWSHAERDLKLALQMAPDEPALLNYLGYSWVERDKNLVQAESMLLRAAENSPDDGAILDSLGWAMLKRNKVLQAVQELEKAVEKIPQDPAVNYHLGVAYWRLGRKIEAINQWNVALLFHPDESDRKKIIKALKEAHAPIPSNIH